jgi:hypothetical protein
VNASIVDVRSELVTVRLNLVVWFWSKNQLIGHWNLRWCYHLLDTNKSDDRIMILFYDDRSLAMYLGLSAEEEGALSYDSGRSITDRRPEHDAAGSADYPQHSETKWETDDVRYYIVTTISDIQRCLTFGSTVHAF